LLYGPADRSDCRNLHGLEVGQDEILHLPLLGTGWRLLLIRLLLQRLLLWLLRLLLRLLLYRCSPC